MSARDDAERVRLLAHHGMRKMAKGSASDMESILAEFLGTVIDATRKDEREACLSCVTAAPFSTSEERTLLQDIGDAIRARGAS